MKGPLPATVYTIDAPGDPEYGTPTSIEVVHTADGGEIKNEDVSKNAAMIPPGFGTPSADTRGTGTYLTPNLAPAGAPIPGAVINGSGSAVITPGTQIPDDSRPSASIGFTQVTDDLYYDSTNTPIDQQTTDDRGYRCSLAEAVRSARK